ncbi:MAG: hypothetical protein OXG70_03090 [Cyanobacteria bacterium MAG IRC1_bin_28]|nr:hypothetical protein [Cyanobacteria bacterium MAG IRC1_bin_28]
MRGSSSRGGGVASPTTPTPPGMLERTGNIKTILTQLAQQVSSSGKGIRSLPWRMNSDDGFMPLALLKAGPGATVRVEMMEGVWSSGDGAAEWSFTFQGTPGEAVILRSFIEGQWRRGGDRDLNIKYHSPTTHPSPGATRVRTGSDASPGQDWAPRWPPSAWS